MRGSRNKTDWMKEICLGRVGDELPDVKTRGEIGRAARDPSMFGDVRFEGSDV